MIDRKPLKREACSGCGTRSRLSVASPAGPAVGGLPHGTNRRMIALPEPATGESRLKAFFFTAAMTKRKRWLMSYSGNTHTLNVYGHLFPQEDDHDRFAAGELALVG